MKVRIAFTTICLFVITHVFSQKNEGFELKGNIPWLKNGDMILLFADGVKSVRDSVRMVNGQFTFKGKVEMPVGATLITVDRRFRMIRYLENTKMTISQKDSAAPVLFTGSVTDDENEALKAICSETLEKIRLRITAVREIEDSALAAQKMDSLQPLFKQYSDLERKFIKDHPKSYVGLGIISKYMSTWGVNELMASMSDLDKSIQESPMGLAISKFLVQMSSTLVGKQAIAFTQQDENGNEVKLDSFKGKYVLIDFWASWCKPCRQENPNVVNAYKRYKDKGFDILGVSLDDNAENWKKAIKDDHLTWTHVSDLKGWKNAVALAYNISSVPANFLLDPNGVIIATNLREDALQRKLAEIFE